MVKPPQSISDADRASWRADAQYMQGEAHISRIFDTRIVYVYGLGLVANAVSDLFNHFLHLRPAPIPKDDTADMVFKAVGLLEKLPLVGEVLAIPMTAAEKAYTLAQTISPEATPKAVDSELDETMKHEEMAVPLFQRILWMRWDLEQKKYAALDRFRETLIERSQDSKFSDTPLSLAKKLFGEAPAEQNRDAIYKLFLVERDRLFKSVIIQYVRKYVSLYKNQKQVKPYGSMDQMVYYSIRGGINYAQWSFIYNRFGKAPDMKAKVEFNAQRARLRLPTSRVSSEVYNFAPSPDPVLGELGDLTKLWGAKSVVSQQTWYGGVTLSEW